MIRSLTARGLWLCVGALAPGAQAADPPAAPVTATASPDEATKLAEKEIDRRVRRMSDELKSPFCPGKTLLNCTSYQAFETRREMKDMALAGKSDEEIMSTLAARFGERTVRNPPQPWYTAIVPFLPFAVGGVLVLWLFATWRRRQREAAAAPPQAVKIEAADRDRLAHLKARAATDDD